METYVEGSLLTNRTALQSSAGRPAVGRVLIVSPPICSSDAIHKTRLFNLIAYLEFSGWVAQVLDHDVNQIDPGIDRLVLIEREGHSAHSLERNVKTRLPAYEGFARHPLDWMDIDSFLLGGETDCTALMELNPSWPPADWAAIVASPASLPVPLTEQHRRLGDAAIRAASDGGSTGRSAEQPVRSSESSAREPLPTSPLVVFVGDAQPRQFSPSRVVSADGTLVASLEAGELALNITNRKRPRVYSNWLGEQNLDLESRLLCVGRDDHVFRVVIAGPTGTYSVVTGDLSIWMTPTREGDTSAAAAYAAGRFLLVEPTGRVIEKSPGASQIVDSELRAVGLDVAVRRNTSWLVVWGEGDSNTSQAAVLRRTKQDKAWQLVQHLEDAIRAGIERNVPAAGESSPPAVWITRPDGKLDRVEIGVV